MPKLTKAYVYLHEHDLHTHESFGRLVADLALKETARILGDDGEADKVNFTLNFEVSAYEPKDCIKICVKSPDGNWWCINQSNSEMEERS